VSLVTGTATIAAVSFVAGLLLTNVPGLTGWDPYGLSIGVLVVSGLILLLGPLQSFGSFVQAVGGLAHASHRCSGRVVADSRALLVTWLRVGSQQIPARGPWRIWRF
jgi:hypothetical protein